MITEEKLCDMNVAEDQCRDLLNSPFIKTRWDELDELLGGISRHELVLYTGISGAGKSILSSEPIAIINRQEK